MLRDKTWIDRSINDPRRGFHFQMANAVTVDGMWHEGTWGYHFYALRALVLHAEGARRFGLDLWGNTRLISMFTLPLACTMPDGFLPRFGDDIGSSPAGYPHLMEAVFYNVRNAADMKNTSEITAAEIKQILPEKPVWETALYGRMILNPPTNTLSKIIDDSFRAIDGSRVFTNAGQIILRQGGKAELAVAANIGEYGGYHGHLDKLSFVFYGFGRELGVDPGRAVSQAYRLPIHRDWYKATISHNAILFNGRSQLPCRGKLDYFTKTGHYAATVVSCEPWRGVRQRRLLMLTDRFLLTADLLSARHNSSFDWVYHNRGTQLVCVAASKPTSSPKIPGGEYVKDCRSGTTTNTFMAVFRDNPVNTILVFAGGATTTVIVGNGPGKSVSDRIPMLTCSRSGKTVWFATLLVPVIGTMPSKVPTLSACAVGDEALQIILQDGETDSCVEFSGTDFCFKPDKQLTNCETR